MKQIVKILVGLSIFLLGTIFINNNYVQAATYENLAYEIIDTDGEQTITITGMIDKATNIAIPSEINGVNVTCIGYKAFYECSNLKNVELSEGIIYIKDFAFSGCNNLQNINLPDSITSIGDYAFSYCSSIYEIHLPNDITVIQQGTFGKCSSLLKINLPESVYRIEDYAFFDCNYLKDLKISDNVTSIGENVFTNCYYLNILCYENSEAHYYARNNDVNYVLIKDLKDAEIKPTYLEYQYTGRELKPEIIVNLNGVTLKEGTDYIVSYENNIEEGIATAIITGKREYEGTKTTTFEIKKIQITDNAIKLAKVNALYTGSAIRPGITVTVDGKVLVKNTDYRVAFANNTEVGVATVTITGLGRYTGTITKTFSIKPNAPIASKSSIYSKAFTARWKIIDTNITGIQIQYSTNADFSNATIKRVSNPLVKSNLKIEGLKGNTTYYVRIRATKLIDGKTYYSAWTTVEKIVAKK